MRARLLVILSVVLTGCAEEVLTAPESVVAADPRVLAHSTAHDRELSTKCDTGWLLIVDGIAIRESTGCSHRLNLEDIEAVEVIKSATPAVLYGATTSCPAIIVRRYPKPPDPGIRIYQRASTAVDSVDIEAVEILTGAAAAPLYAPRQEMPIVIRRGGPNAKRSSPKPRAP